MEKIRNLKIAINILWKASKSYFILTFILSIFSSIPNIINLIVWKKILDLIYDVLIGNNIDFKLIIMYIFAHFLLKMSSNILNKFSLYIQNIYALLVQQFISNETIDAIAFMELADLENYEIHNMIEKANGESGEKMMGLLSKLVDMLQNITTFIGMSGILISFNMILYLIIFLSVIPVALHSQKYFNKMFEMYDKRFEKIRYRNELKNMICRSEVFKEIKLFNNISYLKNKINEIIDEVIDEDRKIKKKLNIQGTFSEVLQLFLTYILKGAIIITGIFSKYTIGTINMNMDSANSVQNATSNIVLLLMSVYEDCLYLTSFSKLLSYKNKIVDSKRSEGEKLIKEFNIETIELVNVWFKYTENSEYVIKNLNCKFVIEKTYAIVGYNGGGKTTLVKVIMGLYYPQKGTILINGKDIKNYDMAEYLKQVSVVFQDFVKYPLTVRENIAMGNIEAMDNIDWIKGAAEVSCSDSFINNLPNKYEEKLVRGWENSAELSIGQWQRIAIARANMRIGKVVIFDEPSASLDAKTESRILNDIVSKKKDKIGIIITHRFLNIKKVDEIIVLKGGEIEAQGKHEELLTTSKVYYELYNSQKELL